MGLAVFFQALIFFTGIRSRAIACNHILFSCLIPAP